MQPDFIIIGLSDGHNPCFGPEAQAAIARGRIFSGGLRHRAIVEHLLPPGSSWIPISVPLGGVFEQYEECLRTQPQAGPIVVFASGDPLFFGFANTLQRRMPGRSIAVWPTFNSLQMLAHRLLMRYDDMRTISLTGRPWPEFDRALIEHAPKIGVLTDREHTPATIAARMMEYGYTQYRLFVGEHLGNPGKELIREMSLPEAAAATFEHPNNLIAVWPQAAEAPRHFGIPDDQFELLDGRKRMITKASIRLLSLQAMQLQNRRTLWDIGFCTGSVSIEARLQFPHLQVVAFEVRPQGEHLLRTNARRFGAPGIQALTGDFLQLPLDGLPRPDAVFIGGHGGRLAEVMARARQVLLPGGCMVCNAVSQKSRDSFMDGARAAGLELEQPVSIALNDYNPIDILKATLR